MAITITPEILGQEATPTRTYAYLYEPLRVRVIESGSNKVYIKLRVRNMETDSIVEDIPDYLIADLNSNGEITIDIMKIIQQHHQANVYNIGVVSDISWETIVAKYKYDLLVSTNITTTPVVISKLLIIGGRSFKQFSPTVTQAQSLTEWQYLGVDQPDFNGFPKVSVTLKSPTSVDARPSVSVSVGSILDKTVCGGYLIFKSRFGGWMTYGFDILSETQFSSYSGDMPSNLFEGSTSVNGNPTIQPNFTGIKSSYKINLKAIAVSRDYANPLRGLSNSPIVFLMEDESSKLELMRLSDASIPLNSLANGANIEVSLKNISSSSQNVR